MANNYPFPLLEVNDLVQHFKQELPELTLTQVDFTSPTSDRWQVMYTVLLEVLTESTPDQLLQPSLDMLSKFEHPDVYEDAIPLFTLAIIMQRVLHACGLDDFSLRDITEPRTKRLQRNMSAILNFLFFRTDRMEVYESIKSQHSDQLKMREAIIKENMDLKAEINKIRSERAEQEPLVKELEERNEGLQKYMAAMSEATSNKKKVLSETNSRIAEKKARLADLKARVVVAKEEGAQLSKQIVQSPRRMKENIQRLGKQLEQLRVVKEERSTRRLELLQMKENLEQVQAFCDQALDHTTKITSDIADQKERQREIQAMRDKVVEKREELNDLETKEHQLLRMISGKQEKLSKMGLTHTNKKKSQENTLQLLIEEKDIISMKQTEGAAEKDMVFQAIRDLRQSDTNNRLQHEQTMEQMRAKYSSLLEQLDVYHSRLTQCWNKVGQLA